MNVFFKFKPRMMFSVSMLSIAIGIALQQSGHAYASNALGLMTESDKRIRAQEEIIQYDMELYDQGQLVHTRRLTRMDKQLTDRNSTLIRFSAPAAVKNVGMLIEDKGAAINDIWSYTPATKSLRRVAGSQKQNWFMGTEFTYEDFEDYKLKAYRFELVATESCKPWAKCSVIDAIPTEGTEVQSSGYSKKRYYIESESKYPVRIDYFDRSGKQVKRLSTEALKMYDGLPRPTAQTMENLSNNRKTRMVLTDLNGKPGLTEQQFTQRALRDEP